MVFSVVSLPNALDHKLPNASVEAFAGVVVYIIKFTKRRGGYGGGEVEKSNLVGNLQWTMYAIPVAGAREGVIPIPNDA